MSKKKKEWRTEKERLLSLTLEERRKEFDHYLTLDKIQTWKEHTTGTDKGSEGKKEHPVSLSDKVSLYKGDITELEVDAIVNAANSSLLGGGGVDGCIHRGAGHFLYDECYSLNGCETGKAKITCGYYLPAKYVIHTVGPIARGNVDTPQKGALKSCYLNSLDLLKENKLRSVAFPCISTGIYGFPNDPAASIALQTVKDWLSENMDEIDRIIFCVFLDTDFEIYKKKMAEFFRPAEKEREEEREEEKPAQMRDDENEVGDVEMQSQVEKDENEAADVDMQSQVETDMAISAGVSAVEEPSQESDQKAEEESAPNEEEEVPEEKKEAEDDTGAEREKMADGKTQTTPAKTTKEDEKDQANSMGTKKKEVVESTKVAQNKDGKNSNENNPEDAPEHQDENQDETQPLKDGVDKLKKE
ncbi:ADP-ribose glycohydrolase MACROD2 isoform X2 [Trichomycterus rosablanca]|uniref:ADP-ribose glycohydrolase MACROD2 isoform X2 n=1 Tax=Trichomycterus rosablanca TaxID=2290929 RepID=UPI002F359931